MRVVAISFWLLALSVTLFNSTAQSAELPLTVSDPELAQTADVVGRPVWTASGTVTNDGTAAYLDVMLDGDVTDASGEVVGYAYGVLTDACGLGVLPDRPLEPGETAHYRLTIELDADDFMPAALDLSISGRETAAAASNPFLTYRDITTVYEGDVARIEWTRRGELRFATGCADDVYTAWQWHTVDVETGEYAAVELPYPDVREPAILDRLALDTDDILRHARIAYHPDSRRFVFQDRINTLLTAEPDGTFQRFLWDDLSRYSLQGYVWLPSERFLAYYFGAFGEPVRYVTASVAGQTISVPLAEVTPSLIVPGPTPDGARVILAQAVDGVEGYYLVSTTNPANQTKLFEGEAPGNNYPAPIFAASADAPTVLYIVRNIDGQARLQCFDMATQTLHTLTVLPLRLADDESGWSALSPDGRLLALAAEGRHGGIWLIDLTQYGACPR